MEGFSEEKWQEKSKKTNMARVYVAGRGDRVKSTGVEIVWCHGF